MLTMRYSAIPFALCAALVACDGRPNRDLTAPDDGQTLDPRDLSLLAPNTWATKAPMLAARSQAQAGTIDSFIYVVGGGGSGGPTSTVQAYNVLGNTWSARRALPSARTALNGASFIGRRLYVTGGYNSAHVLTKTVYVYDPDLDVWARKADMPQAGSCGAQGVIAGLLYVYAGCTNVPGGDQLFRYNPTTNTWVTRAAPPFQHEYPAAGVIAGKFYLAGGGNNDTVHVYTPATNSWTRKARMLGSQSHAASAVINGKLYVAGGVDFANDTLNVLRVYNPATNTWTNRARAPTARLSAAGTAAGGLFFVVGGVAHSVLTRKVEAYTP